MLLIKNIIFVKIQEILCNPQKKNVVKNKLSGTMSGSKMYYDKFDFLTKLKTLSLVQFK